MKKRIRILDEKALESIDGGVRAAPSSQDEVAKQACLQAGERGEPCLDP